MNNVQQLKREMSQWGVLVHNSFQNVVLSCISLYFMMILMDTLTHQHP